MYCFNRRTAEPLEPFSAPGCNKPTSRCQFLPSIGTLKKGKPVIPSVPFIFWATPHFVESAGSLWPTSTDLSSTAKSRCQADNLPLRSSAGSPTREPAFANPRCYLEGVRPRQTNSPALLAVTWLSHVSVSSRYHLCATMIIGRSFTCRV